MVQMNLFTKGNRITDVENKPMVTKEELGEGINEEAQRLKRLPGMRETRVRSLGREDPLTKEMATHSVFMPGKSHEPRSLVGYSPQGCKELDTTERLHFHFHFHI